jgi:multidrug efflux pump subunit AcrA (membrane-fusion protein)
MKSIRFFEKQPFGLPPLKVLAVACAIQAVTFVEFAKAQESAPTTPPSSRRVVAENAVLKIVEIRDVAAETSGIINQALIQEGSLVTADQMIMEIDSTQAAIEKKKAEKELEIARVEAESRVDLKFIERSIEVHQSELSRAIRSNQRRPGVVPQSELDQLALVVNRALAEKEQAEFNIRLRGLTQDVKQVELEMSALKQSQCQIQSPMDGMIVEVLKRKGEWVAISEPVAKVIRLDVLRTEIKVPATDALQDLLGAEAKFYPKLQSDGVQESYAGKVVFIYPEANPISAEVRVWVEIENPEFKLIPGLTGRVKIDPVSSPTAAR